MKSEAEVAKNVFETVEFARCFPESALHEVNCNLCGSSESRVLFKEGMFRIQKCTSCGLVYVSPHPTKEALEEYYARFYPADSDDVVVSWSHDASFRQALRILKHYCPDGGRLLDVGCGLGIFMQTLGNEWEPTGIEPNANACERARKAVPRATIIHGDVMSVPAPAEKYDAATLLASLEHMADPASALQRVGSMLTEKGLIVVRVPYIGPFFAIKHAIPWFPVQCGAPRHLYDFSPRTLRLMLERNGYLVERLYVGSRESVSHPAAAAAVLALKTVSKAAYYVTCRRWFAPFCGSVVAVARRAEDSAADQIST